MLKVDFCSWMCFSSHVLDEEFLHPILDFRSQHSTCIKFYNQSSFNSEQIGDILGTEKSLSNQVFPSLLHKFMQDAIKKNARNWVFSSFQRISVPASTLVCVKYILCVFSLIIQHRSCTNRVIQTLIRVVI